jgi:hypothetical protein
MGKILYLTGSWCSRFEENCGATHLEWNKDVTRAYAKFFISSREIILNPSVMVSYVVTDLVLVEQRPVHVWTEI